MADRLYPYASDLVIFDLESSGLPENRAVDFTLADLLRESAKPAFSSHPAATFHQNVQVLQLYHQRGLDSNQPLALHGEAPASSFVKTMKGYRRGGVFHETPMSLWAERRGFRGLSSQALHSEEQALGSFYGSLERSLALEMSSGRKLKLGGWNVAYDVSLLESSVRRYESLSRYHGWIGKQAAQGNLEVHQMEDVFLDFASRFGRANQDFASKYFRMAPSGKLAGTVEEMRRIPGWKLEDIVRLMGGNEALGVLGDPHLAYTDTRVAGEVYSRFFEATGRVRAGEGFDEAMRRAGILGRKGTPETAESFFTRLYDTAWAREIQRDLNVPGKAAVAVERFNYKPMLGLAAIAGAAALATGMALSKRRDRQTQITGFDEKGLAAVERKKNSDFGSGWRGLDENSPSYKTARNLALAGGLYGGYRWAVADHAPLLHRWLTTVEERFPSKILNTFAPSTLVSSYLLPQSLTLGPEELLEGKQYLASHLNRLMPGADFLGRANAGESFRFKRVSKWSPYMQLDGTDWRVRFAAKSRWTGASFRHGAPLAAAYTPEESSAAGWFTRLRENFAARKSTQGVFGPGHGFTVDGTRYQPLFAEQEGLAGIAKTLPKKLGTVAMEMAERPQRLLSEIGLGLKRGSWNSALGRNGIATQMLVKRVLPLAAGAAALGYVDYLAGHKPSLALASLGPKANLVRAELTDRVPGARSVTDWYAKHVPGPQYGPLALPMLGGAAAGMAHWAKLASGAEKFADWGARQASARSMFRKGAKWGAVAMLPFLPGMLGSRKTADELRDIYSGEEPVPVRSGRWWEVGNTPWEGNRIVAWRPHWFARMQARPFMEQTYGGEKEYWKHNPLLHPLRYLKDPYWLEERNAEDRPYPMTSPAGSNIPLIGPIVAATIGRLIKPPRRMREQEWNGDDYTLFSSRVEPRGEGALAPSRPVEEYRGLGEIARRQTEIGAEFIGLPGFLGKTVAKKIFKDNGGADPVYYEGSRQMTSWGRRYYSEELGAGLGPAPGMESLTTYSEPFRRFVQRDLKTLQANELRNKMPSWMPGAEYMIDFRKGDPYNKVPGGWYRLPGAGYESMHPEVKGLAAEDYPAMERFRVLSDVAPWSTEWFKYRGILARDTSGDTEQRIEYEKILGRAEAIKESSVRFDERRFTGETEELEGTVASVSPQGIELAERPGQRFGFSALATSASDMSAVVLGEHNDWTRSAVAKEVDRRIEAFSGYLSDELASGTKVKLVVPKGAGEHANYSRAVVMAGSKNINRAAIEAGLAREDVEDAGAEYRAMSGAAGKALGAYAEKAAYTGDTGKLNPLHWLPAPFHSKLWQQRTALEQYRNQEVYGSRMRRWDRPLSDIAGSWMRGTVYRVTGNAPVPYSVRERRDLDTLEDMLSYLRSAGRGYTSKTRTAIGANLAGSPAFLRQTLTRREKYYFDAFLGETDPDKRERILESVSPEMARILQAQWVARDLALRKSRGESVPQVFEGGRLRTREEAEAYEQAREDGETRLDFGDWERSREVSQFFFRRHLRLPDSPDSPALDPAIDYEDVKAKIVQEEGLDMHDFGIFDDRASLLWRKPYVTGAVRELTRGDDRSVEQLRRAVEEMIVAGSDKNPDVRISSLASRSVGTNIRVRVDERPDKEILDDIRRNREEYEDQ